MAQSLDAEPPDFLFVSADLGLLTIARAQGKETTEYDLLAINWIEHQL